MPELGSARLKVVAAERAARPRPEGQAGVIVICPDEAHRATIRNMVEASHGRVLSEFSVYPNYNHLLSILGGDCDAFLIEVETDIGMALDLVESVCSRKPAATVMVYASRPNPDLLLRSMRSGAREFLTAGTPGSEVAEALARAAVRHAEQTSTKTRGKVLAFWGAKGGSGVTTIAANVAIALKAESGEGVALVDLNPQLGDVAVLLGITPQFTIADALRDPDRVDEEFVANLATPHPSGVSVIAAPDEYNSSAVVDARALGRLLEAVRGRYAYVVVDAGVGLGAGAEALFQTAHTIYVVAQPDIASLRNSQRFLSHLREYGAPSIEFVLNRFEARKTEFDDDRLAKALGVAPRWKVPNDYASARRATNTGAPLLASGSPVAKALRQMARAACGKAAEEEGKKGFRLFT